MSGMRASTQNEDYYFNYYSFEEWRQVEQCRALCNNEVLVDSGGLIAAGRVEQRADGANS